MGSAERKRPGTKSWVLYFQLGAHYPLSPVIQLCVRHPRKKDRKSPTSYLSLTCKRGSVGQSEGLIIPRSSIRFYLKPKSSNAHRFGLRTPRIKGTKLLLKVKHSSLSNKPKMKEGPKGFLVIHPSP